MRQDEIKIDKVYAQHSGLRRRVLSFPKCDEQCPGYRGCGSQYDRKCVEFIHLNGPSTGTKNVITLRRFAAWVYVEMKEQTHD